MAAPQVYIVPTEPVHIREIIRTMRDPDRKEIEDLGIAPSKAVWRSYKRAINPKTAMIDGEVIATWGLNGVYLSDTGHPWLVTAPGVKKISSIRFARLYQNEVYQMLQIFPYLVNWVSEEYTESVRMLQIIGFDVGSAEKLGRGMFRKFEMRAQYVC